MFVVLLLLREENIATPPKYIFVFANEVLKKINTIFLWQNIINLCSIRCVPIYPLEIFLRPLLRNNSLARQVYNKNEN